MLSFGNLTLQGHLLFHGDRIFPSEDSRDASLVTLHSLIGRSPGQQAPVCLIYTAAISFHGEERDIGQGLGLNKTYHLAYKQRPPIYNACI